jgi:TolB-like protein/Tfp pilus assembly protein PilF
MNAGNFFAELKRRNVYKVAIAYAIVAWLLIQAASILFPTFEAPTWVMKVFVIMVAAGFPISLVIAWAFEMTPQGMKRTEQVGPNEFIPQWSRRKFFGLLAVVAVLALGLLMFQWSRPKPAVTASPMARAIPERSIVVLPFENTSGNPDMEYLSDGICEALINSLTELQQLRVIARSTAFRYKGRQTDPQAIGRELKVRTVLMGFVRQAGDRLNVQVDLVDATTGAQLWGEGYERKASDLLSIKQAIAREITEKLRLRLSGDEQRQLTKRDTANADAYQFYLRGRYYWNKRTVEGIKKAVEQFQQAIVKDSNYALAYVGLADCHLVLEQYAGTPVSETLPKARAAAMRALEIDDSLAEAHTSLAFYYDRSWQWEESEKEFKRALILNPNYPTARHWYSIYLRTVGRLDEAMGEIERARELDPLSAIINVNLAMLHLLKGEFNATIEQCKWIIELYPNYPDGYRTLAFTYVKQQRYPEAIAEMNKAVVPSGRSSEYLGALGYCYAVAGRREDALATLRELEAKYARGESIAAHLATVHGALGDKDQAFAWLEKDFQARSGELGDLAWRPYFDPLRDDPRYSDLLRRMNLKP